MAELAKRTSISQDKALALTGSLKSRGILVNITPPELAKQWSQVLGVAEQEMALFFIEAEYVI